MRIPPSLGRFVRDDEGAVAIFFAAMVIMLLGVAAVTIDLGHGRLVQTQLHKTSTASALGAALDLPNTTTATATALSIATTNTPTGYGTVTNASDVEFGNFDDTTQTFTITSTNINAVRVYARRTAARGNLSPSFFSGILGNSAPEVVASAIAMRLGPRVCVIVLDPTASGALSVSGGGTFSVPNCGVAVNSSHSRAATAGNNTTARAKSFCIVGGTFGGGTFTPTPTTGCAAVADPLASIVEPTAGTCELVVPTGGTITAGASGLKTFCSNVSLNSNTTFEPGTYYFTQQLSIGGSVSVTGSGVTLVFGPNATLNHTSSGSVNLSAPTSGTYRGIVLFQSRSASVSNAMKFTGSSSFTVNGTLYLPTGLLNLTGSSTVTVNSQAGWVIAQRLQYGGNSTFTLDMPSANAPSALAPRAVLVQ